MTTRIEAMRLLDSGMSMNATSKALGVSRSAIRDWRDNGIAPRGSECPLDDPAVLDRKAYSALFGFYLGDGCVSTYRGKHFLRVACDLTYPGIIKDVSALIVGVNTGSRSFAFRRQDGATSRAAGSTGRVCSRSTAPAASTSVFWSLSTGSRRLSRSIRSSFSAACSIQTGAASRTGQPAP